MSTKERFYAAVFVVVLNDKGEVLLHQRANSGYMDGYYDFPSGHIEPNEGVRIAASRELSEETGLFVREEDLTLVHINQNFFEKPYLNYTFIAEKWQGEPTIGEPDKCTDMKFFNVNELPAKCTPGVRVVERAAFGRELTYSIVRLNDFSELMGEPYRNQ